MVLPFVLALLPLDPILNIFPPGVAGGWPIGEVAPKVGAFVIALPNEYEAAGAGACWLLGGGPPPNWNTPGTAAFAVVAKLNPVLLCEGPTEFPAAVLLAPKAGGAFCGGDAAPKGAEELFGPELPNEKIPPPALPEAADWVLLVFEAPNWNGFADTGLDEAVVDPNGADGFAAANPVGFVAPKGVGWEVLALFVLPVVPPNLNCSDVLDAPLCPNEKLFCGALDGNVDPANWNGAVGAVSDRLGAPADTCVGFALAFPKLKIPPVFWLEFGVGLPNENAALSLGLLSVLPNENRDGAVDVGTGAVVVGLLLFVALNENGESTFGASWGDVILPKVKGDVLATGCSVFPNEKVDAAVCFDTVLSEVFFCPKLNRLVEVCPLFPGAVSNVNGFVPIRKNSRKIWMWTISLDIIFLV
jgi:hypothetical protein